MRPGCSRWIPSAFGAALLVLLAAPHIWALQRDPLTITTASVPSTTTGSHYSAALHATGGVQPYHWELAHDSALPPGLRLHPHSDQISGTPDKAGEYHFTLALTDSDSPAHSVRREFTITIVSALTIDWKHAPKVSGTSLAGSVVVTNHMEHSATLTVVIVAVNQIGRATTLGYQHFHLAAGAEQEIPFGASPGPGSYVVHADAVAESTTAAGIRARKQTPRDQPLVIQQL